MTSPLETLAGPGKPLRAEPPDAKEFAGLLRSGQSRLKDAGNKSLSLESRFDLGYNAAHALCRAAAASTSGWWWPSRLGHQLHMKSRFDT